MFQRFLILLGSLSCAFLYILAFSSELNFSEAKGDLCPLILKKLLGDENSCERVTCKTTLDAKSCVERGLEYQEKLTLCGCCPGCVNRTTLEEGDECGPPHYADCEEKVCPVIVSQCPANFVCSKDTNSCVKMDDSEEDLKECEKKRVLGQAGELHWTPNCNPDGSYAPVQCKGQSNSGNSFCFCTDKKGKRIFGRKRWTDEPDMMNMTCGCSLHAHELRENNQIATLHCTYDGNYEPLQCDSDSGLCYCVDPFFGKLTGAVLPEKNWMDLPCYNSSLGTSYLRQCDSISTAVQRINNEANLHGLKLEKYSTPDCDYDGSYKRYQENGRFDECVHKNGDRNIFFRTHGHNNLRMDCNCAREYEDLEMEGLNNEGSRQCDEQGNFELLAIDGTAGICIDEDGFIFYSVPVDYVCCLDSTCGNEALGACFPNDPNGYKNCNDILT